MEDEQFETEDWHDTEEIGSQLEQVNLAHPAARRAVPVPYARIVVYGLRQAHTSLKYPPHLKMKEKNALPSFSPEQPHWLRLFVE